MAVRRMVVKAVRVGRDHPKLHGLSLVFLLSLLLLSHPPFLGIFFVTFPFFCFSILRFWNAGLRRSGSPTRASRAGRGQEMVT